MISARRRPVPPAIYAIADLEALGAARAESAVEDMAASGVGWVQLRAKRTSDRELHRLAETCVRRLEGSTTVLWVDDRADVAALVRAGGVHVGQSDLPPEAARRAIGEQVWIGRSTHDERQLLEADADPEVDVIAVGPIFETRSKEQPDPTVGLEGLRRFRALTAKPLIAIGGIEAGNVAQVLEAGADSAAILGAICRGDVGANCRRLLRATGAAS